MKVSDILRVKGATLYTVSPNQTLLQAIYLMAEKDIGSLVVMDRGQLVGLLSFREIIRAIADSGDTCAQSLVRTAMYLKPTVCDMACELDTLRHLMLDHHARYVPVMEGAVLMGVVSFYDVERAVVASQDFENRLLKAYIRDWPDQESAK